MADGVARRHVLAAIAALSTIALSGKTSAAEASREVEVTESEFGSRIDIESGEPVWSDALILCEGDDAEIDISGHHHPDGVANVEFTAYNGAVSLTLGLSPERARELAEDLQLAADHAENGVDA
jgi:hypothetical protein